MPAQSQVQLLSAQVSGSDGELLTGATVAVIGLNKGTVTDSEGKFRLYAANDDLIRISYIGYETAEFYPDEITFDHAGRVVLREGNWLREVVITAQRMERPPMTITTIRIVCDSIGTKGLHISTTPMPWHYYPNPTTDGVMVETDMETGFICVFSMDGKRVARQPISRARTRVELAGLRSGFYLLQYENNGWTQTIGKVCLVLN
jgi:hypothetical protein